MHCGSFVLVYITRVLVRSTTLGSSFVQLEEQNISVGHARGAFGYTHATALLAAAVLLRLQQLFQMRNKGRCGLLDFQGIQQY